MIETFATDEHRLGLKPVLRRVWAPRGERPVAVGHHRFEWLYVTAFVAPKTGESFWYLSTGVSKQDFEDVLALFAREAGAGRDRIILLVLDNAGWHSPPGLTVPEGIRLVYLPPYTPELQPAETLWVHLDEPIVNRHFDTLAELDAVAGRYDAVSVKLGEAGGFRLFLDEASRQLARLHPGDFGIERVALGAALEVAPPLAADNAGEHADAPRDRLRGFLIGRRVQMNFPPARVLALQIVEHVLAHRQRFSVDRRGAGDGALEGGAPEEEHRQGGEEVQRLVQQARRRTVCR